MKKIHELGIVLIVTFVVFFPALFGEFLAFDDELLIVDNPTVHELSFANIHQAFSTYDPELYIPLTLLTHQIEWAIAGDSPMLYHVTNLLLHLLSTAFVFLILRRLFSQKIAIVCALLFSLHPLQVESIAWISGRKDVLASAFFLASTYTYLQWKDTGQRKALSVILFLCGLLSKVSIFPLPFCLLLLDYLHGEQISRERIKEKASYFLLAFVFLIIAVAGKQTQVSDPVTAIMLSPVSIVLTVQHIVFPVGLTIFYPYIENVAWSNPQVLLGFMLLVFATVVSFYTLKRTRLVLFCTLWVGILIIPSLLNMQKGGEFGIPDTYLTSDRYAYLALLGPVILMGYILRKTNWSIGLLVVLIFGITSYKQIAYWNNSDALFRRVIEVDQPSHVAYTNIGGFSAQADDLEEAEILFTKSLDIRRSSRALYNLAQIKAHIGKKEEALSLYRELLILNPRDNSARSKMNSLL